MTWQQVYWITRLDALHTLLVAIAVLSFLSCIVFMAVGAAIYDSWSSDPDHIAHDHAVSKKWFKRIIPMSIVTLMFTALACLCPSTKEAAAIYLIPKVVNNEHTKNIGDKGLKLLEAKFDEWLKETTGEEAKGESK